MTATAEVVIKGRSELGQAVKQAEQQLKGLLRTGDLVGKVFRGGAIVGAALAFERLAQSAEQAAIAIGDKGTARSLHSLNKAIDDLKNKGTNIIGRVLGNISSIIRNDELGKINEQIEFLKNNLTTGFLSVGYGRIGTGVFTVAETRAKLAELEKAKKLYEQNRPYGEWTRGAPGSHAGGQAIDNFEMNKVTIPKVPWELKMTTAEMREMQRYADIGIKYQERQQEITGITNDLQKTALSGLQEITAQVEAEHEALFKEFDALSLYADQAARNMQDSFAQFLFDPFQDGIKGMLKGFIDTIRQMAAQMAASEIFQMIGNWAMGSSYGWLASFGSAMVSGKRAGGGPVSKGHVYTVGERGRETFVPSSNGYILPNGAGGGITINQSIDASGADADRIMAMMPGLLKQTKDQTIAEIRDLQNRGRL